MSPTPNPLTLLANGRILDRIGDRRADVLVDATTGQVVATGTDLLEDGREARVLDIAGCVVAPGLVDLHAHLREPGGEAAETVLTGSRAAARGGFTAVVAMPDTHPCLDSAETWHLVRRAAETALCDVIPAGAVSVGRRGVELAPMAELARLGVRVFTDANGIQDPRFMRRALEYAGSIVPTDGVPVVVATHGEVAELSAGTHMHEGAWSVRLGLGGQSALAEELMVMRDLALARSTGARIHFQHLSTRRSIELIRAAKAEGLAVTAAVTPHHFSLTDAACAGYDPRFKVQPPLRPADDLAAVRAALADGTIDAIATDHAPHSPDAKERPFDQAPPGMLGLETALAVALADSGLGLAALLPLLSWQPAVIAGLGDRHGRPIEAGEPANLIVVDPDHRWTVRGQDLASNATNTPFEGRELNGKVRHTVYDGELVVIDGEATR